jgi:hypothetical protein
MAFFLHWSNSYKRVLVNLPARYILPGINSGQAGDSLIALGKYFNMNCQKNRKVNQPEASGDPIEDQGETLKNLLKMINGSMRSLPQDDQ